MSGYYDKKFHDGDDGRQLVLTLPSGRRVMDYQVEMIANNEIYGLLPFRNMTADGKPRFFYDVSGLVAADEYMRDCGRSIRFLAGLLMEVSVAIGGLDKFLLEEKCLLLHASMIFIDPSRQSAKLVYLPAEPPEDRLAPFSELVMDLIAVFSPDDATGKLFCRKIIEEVKRAGFKYDAFTDFLMDILCFSDDAQHRGAGGYEQATAQRGGSYGIGAGSGLAGAKDGAKAGLKSGASTGAAGAAGAAAAFGGFARQVGTRFGGLAVKPAANGGRVLLPVLCAIVVAVVYFGAMTYIPRDLADGAVYRGAALISALGAELLLMRYFITCNGAGLEAGGSKKKRGGEFSEAVKAASAIYEANAAADAADGQDGNDDLWANSAKRAEQDEPEVAVDSPDERYVHIEEGDASQIDAGGALAMPIAASAAAIPYVSDAAPIDEASEVGDGACATSEIENDGNDGWPIYALDDQYHSGLEDGGSIGTPASTLLDEYLSKMQLEHCRDFIEMDDYPYADGFEDGSGVNHRSGFSDDGQANMYPPTEVLPFTKRVDATLTVRGAMREFGVTLIENEFTIGRRKEHSDLVLDNPAVGKAHAKLEKEDDLWYVRDMYSRNGTYLNNIKLDSGARKALHSTDMITVANVDMLFTPSAEQQQNAPQHNRRGHHIGSAAPRQT
ncbi:MAG: FHA domain-containing protein [Oscillospiraceae bacterium]|nr:FHA domain-containing protein [Oscillospiraceae bacterium]